HFPSARAGALEPRRYPASPASSAAARTSGEMRVMGASWVGVSRTRFSKVAHSRFGVPVRQGAGSLESQRSPRVRQRDHQRHLVEGRGYEAMALVEALRVVRDRVHDEGADAPEFGSLKSSED